MGGGFKGPGPIHLHRRQPLWLCVACGGHPQCHSIVYKFRQASAQGHRRDGWWLQGAGRTRLRRRDGWYACGGQSERPQVGPGGTPPLSLRT